MPVNLEESGTRVSEQFGPYSGWPRQLIAADLLWVFGAEWMGLRIQGLTWKDTASSQSWAFFALAIGLVHVLN